MARGSRNNKSNILDDLFETFRIAPWWVGPIVAVLAFLVISFIAPLILGTLAGVNPVFRSMATVWAPLLSILPYMAAGAIALTWLVAMMRRMDDAERLDQQSGPDSIRQLGWREFESLLAEAFRRQGYHVEELGGPQPDGGIDLRLHQGGTETLVQCKHWKKYKVGVTVVRELKGVMATRGAQGIVVSSGDFTREARDFAQNAGVRLIDGEALVGLIQSVQRNPPIPQTTAPQYTPNTPACPQCGSAMILRTAKRSEHKGTQFWGCANYPKCRGIVNV